MIVYTARKDKSRNCYVAKIVKIRSLQTLAAVFSSTCFAKRKKNMTKESLDCSGKTFDELKCCVCAARRTALTTDSLSNKFKFNSKGLNKRTLEDSGDVPMANYQKVLDEIENITSTNNKIHTNNLCVATYERRKEGLLYFYPKQAIESDGSHTILLKV